MDKILGIWQSDPDDESTIKSYGKITLEFKETGELWYTIYETNKIQKIYMTYEIKDNIIISDQSSSPQKQETEFRLLPNGKLELIIDGLKSTYIKM